jgi:hypothetical protein
VSESERARMWLCIVTVVPVRRVVLRFGQRLLPPVNITEFRACFVSLVVKEALVVILAQDVALTGQALGPMIGLH